MILFLLRILLFVICHLLYHLVNVNVCVICVEVDIRSCFRAMSAVEEEYRENNLGPKQNLEVLQKEAEENDVLFFYCLCPIWEVRSELIQRHTTHPIILVYTPKKVVMINCIKSSG